MSRPTLLFNAQTGIVQSACADAVFSTARSVCGTAAAYDLTTNDQLLQLAVSPLKTVGFPRTLVSTKQCLLAGGVGGAATLATGAVIDLRRSASKVMIRRSASDPRGNCC